MDDLIRRQSKNTCENTCEVARSANDCISRQDAIDLWEKYHHTIAVDAMQYDAELRKLPPIQQQYEPVTAEDFAKTMSENTFYGFMAWHGEALELMERQGLVICKKTM